MPEIVHTELMELEIVVVALEFRVYLVWKLMYCVKSYVLSEMAAIFDLQLSPISESVPTISECVAGHHTCGCRLWNCVAISYVCDIALFHCVLHVMSAIVIYHSSDNVHSSHACIVGRPNMWVQPL